VRRNIVITIANRAHVLVRQCLFTYGHTQKARPVVKVANDSGVLSLQLKRFEFYSRLSRVFFRIIASRLRYLIIVSFVYLHVSVYRRELKLILSRSNLIELLSILIVE
jgi:hypothetical protein